PQAEIRQYLEDVAHKFEIVNQIKLNTEVINAEWNNGLNRWLISTRDGK
ncbi:UNVERIFIED_CONTAM: NAD(P)/FAD-dependent oxidoreductase, partial [Cronobacter sakazakii]